MKMDRVAEMEKSDGEPSYHLEDVEKEKEKHNVKAWLRSRMSCSGPLHRERNDPRPDLSESLEREKVSWYNQPAGLGSSQE